MFCFLEIFITIYPNIFFEILQKVATVSSKVNQIFINSFAMYVVKSKTLYPGGDVNPLFYFMGADEMITELFR
jgi:two-component SAPR family response regulator